MPTTEDFALLEPHLREKMVLVAWYFFDESVLTVSSGSE